MDNAEAWDRAIESLTDVMSAWLIANRNAPWFAAVVRRDPDKEQVASVAWDAIESLNKPY